MSTTHGSHGHHHMATDRLSLRSLKISAWLTGIYCVIELGIGIWTGSIAVLSDAFHTFSAVGGILIAIIASRIARRPATPKASFGYSRAEIIGALFNGLSLFIMAALVFWMGVHRLMAPIDLPTTPMLVAAGLGLITELIALKILYQEQKTNLNTKGAYWHILQTFVGSLIIIVVALVIKFFNYPLVDPILGMAFGLALIWAAWGITKGSLDLLLEKVPEGLDLNEIEKAIKALLNVRDVHHLHAWAISSGKNIVSLHVVVDDWQFSHDVLKKTQSLLYERFDLSPKI